MQTKDTTGAHAEVKQQHNGAPDDARCNVVWQKDRKLYECTGCMYRSERKSNVSRHFRRIHCELHKYRRCACGKLFSTKGEYYEHSVREHTNYQTACYFTKKVYKIGKKSMRSKRNKLKFKCDKNNSNMNYSNRVDHLDRSVQEKVLTDPMNNNASICDCNHEDDEIVDHSSEDDVQVSCQVSTTNSSEQLTIDELNVETTETRIESNGTNKVNIDRLKKIDQTNDSLITVEVNEQIHFDQLKKSEKQILTDLKFCEPIKDFKHEESNNPPKKKITSDFLAYLPPKKRFGSFYLKKRCLADITNVVDSQNNHNGDSSKNTQDNIINFHQMQSLNPDEKTAVINLVQLKYGV